MSPLLIMMVGLDFRVISSRMATPDVVKTMGIMIVMVTIWLHWQRRGRASTITVPQGFVR